MPNFHDVLCKMRGMGIIMDEMWGAVIGSLGFTALLITPFIVNRIIKFKLEIAKINAQTTIKAEEIRAQNQLEIERMLKHENNSAKNSHFENEEFELPDRIKRRV